MASLSRRPKSAEDRSQFRIDLGGPAELDVLALNGIAANIAEIVDVVAEKYAPDTVPRLFIRAPKQGSIHFDFATVLTATAPALPLFMENAKFAVDVVKI